MSYQCINFIYIVIYSSFNFSHSCLSQMTRGYSDWAQGHDFGRSFQMMGA